MFDIEQVIAMQGKSLNTTTSYVAVVKLLLFAMSADIVLHGTNHCHVRIANMAHSKS